MIPCTRMIRVIAPLVDGFAPKKANKYRETRVEVTFKNSAGGGSLRPGSLRPAKATKGRREIAAGGLPYFMNRLHINCRGSLRNWKKAREPYVEQLAPRERTENFFNYCWTLTRRGLYVVSGGCVRACVGLNGKKWILGRSN